MNRTGDVAGEKMRAIVALIRRVDEAIGSGKIVALVRRIEAIGSGTPMWEEKSNAPKPRAAAKARNSQERSEFRRRV
jgi:hypothetical protein